MTNFDEFKQKAKDTMETIADKSIELYKIAEEKTKIFAKITKLSTEVALEKGNVRKLYREIGKKYYDLHKANPEEALAQTCTEVTSTLDRIAVKQKEIEEIKSSYNLGEKDAVKADKDNEDVEVEIIIEDVAGPVESAAENPAADMDDDDDILGNNPPEFKL